jgi:uncharacterized RDD family membrane protein YckC
MKTPPLSLNSFSRLNRVRRTALLIAVVSISCAATVRAADQPGWVRAYSAGEMLWIARSRTVADQVHSEILSHRLLNDSSFRGIADLSGRIVSLTNRSTDAVALLDSGQWIVVWNGGSSMGASPPDNVKLIALAGGVDVMWGIASSAGSSPGLYRWRDGQWERLSDAPAGTTASATSLNLIGDKPVLAFRSNPTTIEVQSFDPAAKPDAARWQSVAAVRVPQSTVDFVLLYRDQAPLLWSADASGAGQINFPGTNRAAVSLSWNGPDDARDGRAIAATSSDLRLIMQRGSRLYQQSFDLNGNSLGKAIELPVAPEESTPDWYSTMVVALLVMALLTMGRRQGQLPVAVLKSTGVRLAPLSRRFAAGMIDAMPVLLTTAFIITRITMNGTLNEESLAQNQYRYPMWGSVVFYILYTTLSEVYRGCTLGKWLFGLRVVSIDTSPPKTGAIITRNIMRIADVTVGFLTLGLIFLTPLRQRIGDLAARTMVVMEDVTPPNDKTPEQM